MIRSAVIFIILTVLIVGCSANMDSEGYYQVASVDDPLMLPYKFTIWKKKVALGSSRDLILQQYVPVDIYGSGITGMYLICDNWRPADSLTAILFYADIEEKNTLSQINVNTTHIASHFPYDFNGDNVIEVAVTYTTRDTLWLDIIDPHQRRIYRRPLVVGQDRDGNGFWDGSGTFCGVYDFNDDGYVELLVNCDVGYDLYPRKLMCVDWFNNQIVWEYEIAGIINSEHTYVEPLAQGNKPSIVFGVGSKGNAAKAGDMDDQHSYLIVLDENGKLRWKKETGGVFSSCVPILIDYDNNGTTEVLTTCRYEAPRTAGEADVEHGGMFKIYDMYGSVLDSIDYGVGRIISSVRLLDFDSDGLRELFVSLSDASIIIYDQRLQPVRKAKFYTAAGVWDCRDFLGTGNNQLLIASRDNKLWLLDKGFKPMAQFGEGEDLHYRKSAVYKARQSQQGFDLIVAGNSGQVNYFLSLVKSPWNTVFFRYPLLAFLAALLPMSLVVALIWFNWRRTRKQKRNVSQQRDRLNTALEDLRAAQEKLIAIEEYNETQEALRASENRYKTLVENLPQRIFLKDKDSTYVSCNQNYARDLRIKPDEIAGKTDYEFYPKELAEKYRADDKRIVESGKIEDIEERYIQNGQDLWVHTVKTPVKDEKGDIVGVLGIFWDITEHKQAEEALRESEEKYRDLTEKMVDVIYTLDTEGTVTSVNEAIKTVLGFQPKEVIGRKFATLIPKEERPEAMAAFQRILSGERLTRETVLVDKNGELHNVEFSSSPIIKCKKTIGTRGIVRDITERKRIEAREKARLQLLNDLRTARNIDVCLEHGCKAIYEAGLFKRAVLTLHNKKKEIINLGQVGLDEGVVQAARNAPAPDEELSKSMTQEEYRISHSYFIPEEAALGLKGTARYISQTDSIEREDSSWREGDELFVPIIGDDDKYEGWLSVDTPFDGERPTVEIVRFLEQVVDIMTQKVREIITLEKLREGHRALLESEERFRNVSASAQDAILMMDNEGCVSFWNKAAEKVFGYQAQEILGKSLHETLGAERFHDAYRKGFGQFRETGEGAAVGQTLELAAVRKDGTEFPIELSVSAIKLKGKWNAVGILRDITERKRAEEKLKSFSLALSSSIDGIAMGDLDSRITYVNEVFTEMFGYSREELIGKEIAFLYAEDQIAKLKEAIKATIEGGWAGELVARRKDGGLFPIRVSASRVVDDEGIVTAVMASHQDITERRMAEEALRESEARYQELFDSVQEGIAVVDENLIIRFCNPAYARIFEEDSVDDLIGRSLFDYVPEDQTDLVLSQIRIRKSHRTSQYELDIVTARNQRKTILASMSPRFDRNNKYRGAFGAITDITDRKRAEAALRSERDFVHSLLDTANSLIVCLDNQARITVFNNECEKVTGYTREEVIGKSWPEIFLPEDHHHHRLKDFAEWVRQHPRDMYEGQLKTKSGQFRTILWSNSALFPYDSDELTAIAVGQDITERKKAERQLQVASQKRYNQVKEIAGGVSHEIFNALFPATSCLNKLSQRLDLNRADELARNRKLIQVVENAVQRAVEMTELVTEYSKLESDRKIEDVSLQAILQEILLANESRIEELKVKVKLEVSGDFLLKCHRPHIYSLFNNLMVNALDALAEVKQRNISILACKKGSRLSIEFSDSGVGIPPENIDKIFDAFFSTKPRTGTGLGLAVSKKIVELYSGSIEVNSSLDKGTKFIILL